jgi:anthranilate phosphoribosyltransferase
VENPENSRVSAEHPFAQYIRILGKGKTGTRSLTRTEAHAAFGMILAGEAEALQLGAFLMLLRVKEESAQELAGFVDACRENMQPPPSSLHAHLDWSSYAGKKHQHPWFILSMLLLTEAGHRIFIHGSSGHTPGRLYTEQAMEQLGLPVAADWAEVSEQLDSSGLSYLSLKFFCNPLQELMQLRSLLGLRSPVNTLARMLNPLRAPTSLQSIFHPAYAALHQEADNLLQQPRALVFKGESGEVEIKPQADTRLHLLQDHKSREIVMGRSLQQRPESVATPGIAPLKALWQGEGEENDRYGLEATLATAATALLALEPGLSTEEAQLRATELWKNRNTARFC